MTLHYHHLGEILPSMWDCSFTITPPGEPPPQIFQAIIDANLLNSRGSYQGVFAYSFHKFPDVHDPHLWLMLLWDRIIITASFHDPACECEKCSFVGQNCQRIFPATDFLGCGGESSMGLVLRIGLGFVALVVTHAPADRGPCAELVPRKPTSKAASLLAQRLEY